MSAQFFLVRPDLTPESALPVPDYQTFMRPVLAHAAAGQECNSKDVIAAVADQFHLTEDERSELLTSGKQTVLANRVHWAITYLAKAGALTRTKRSHFVITDRGKQLLIDHPGKVDTSALKQFPEFLNFVAPSSDNGDHDAPDLVVVPTTPEVSDKTPEEAIQSAEEALMSDLKGKLLDRIAEMTPAFFEGLVVDLIVAMGYGGNRQAVAKRLGKSGDEGIDGVVNEDPLGLDTVYIQAKRYAPDNVVGREKVQQFAGALVGQSANKGVFVTTSKFTQQAKEYADGSRSCPADLRTGAASSRQDSYSNSSCSRPSCSGCETQRALEHARSASGTRTIWQRARQRRSQGHAARDIGEHPVGALRGMSPASGRPWPPGGRSRRATGSCQVCPLSRPRMR
ncbi:restriction endonuclease [Cereibacter sphaeroides]|uniref:restriction endonuclease n=1 Tax=Cereibacter sphaeroides TaxID=1063 RepID=UPI001F3A942F|nr:restriction endonuclease [Cereibacter sphaeroides]MCE6959122.1 restriction endonuclease [Cereibacter sphaeroides]MCE6974217.1 restriction endonuclease [Cereibacter sphaeroides]